MRRKGKALCERPFASAATLKVQAICRHCPPTGKNFADTCGKGVWGHSNENLPINAVCNIAERSFSKLRIIKMFHRSIMSDEKLAILAMISIESELAKTLDKTELTKTFALKTCKKSYSSLKQANVSVCLLDRLCWRGRKCFYKHLLK